MVTFDTDNEYARRTCLAGGGEASFPPGMLKDDLFGNDVCFLSDTDSAGSSPLLLEDGAIFLDMDDKNDTNDVSSLFQNFSTVSFTEVALCD